ncbi:hypothetical protein BO86DRAFT_426885 [Aspergillus japonicus CBS 114.51]|uniref:Uncharacterized protein n=1 Tax=Aspergillus japonicus CBS 114.51 TaxID=1448312 RepID=A0A8T8X4U7_ASPJA|nr:hypothetical protein BO86DRAFT_426885 [Aspergillus japonicus CBS 114.51]RAH83143.1 hypothetical protein BO86DRAFT_426885 [Aspergillus japonicus CBS 114.51]
MCSLRLSLSHFAPLLRTKLVSIASSGPPLPPGILIDEEISPFYNPNHFYPAKPGETLNDGYQTLVKFG